MTIGIDASRANKEQRTGVENYAFHLIEEMKRLQTADFRFQIGDLKFVLYSDRPLEGELAKLPANWESKVLRWPPRLLPALREGRGCAGQAWRLWTQVRLSWEMLVNPPDVLFIPAHVFPIIHPKKTVMTVHDVAAARFPETYNWFERWYSIFTAKMAARWLWRIIVPSQYTKNELKKLRNYDIAKLEEKVFVVPHGYDTRYRKIENKIEIEQILNKYSVRRPFIMSVGRLEEKKNTVRIIEAFNILKIKNCELKILLAGAPGFGFEKVKAAIDASPCKSDIITPGWVRPDDLPQLMNAASAFVFPSLYEGFGLPVLEAFACGTPVVAAKGSSLEEVGGDAAVYVDPSDASSVADGILRILNDVELREAHIRKGLERVRHFSWDRCAAETLAVLTR